MQRTNSFFRIILVSFGIGFITMINPGCKKSSDSNNQGSATAPVLITASVSNISSTSANCGGSVTSDGGAAVTSRGVCWSTAQNPTISDSKTSDGNGTGSFTSSLQSLTPSTPYYVRAYATNSKGTSYGDVATFTTTAIEPGTVVDIDGNVYHKVTIGTQVWLVENLKVTHYRNGDPITLGGPKDLMNKTEGEGMYYNYGNSDSIAKIYGRLYNFYAGTDSRICAPLGFRVASDSDWSVMANYLGNDSLTGGKLKEIGTVHWLNPNLYATNETGFTALPGGFYNGLLGTFGFIGISTSFWTSTSTGTYYADGRSLFNNSGYILGAHEGDGRKVHGWSIRCVQGEKKSR